MIIEQDLRELLDHPASGPVLSLYLNTAPSAGTTETYKLRLKNLLKEAGLPQDANLIERHFNLEYDWNGRGVAVFSNAATNFLRVFPLGIPVRDQVYVTPKAIVKPLADLLDDYGGYGVILVDRQGARAFFYHLGELLEQEGVMGEAVKHTKLGGASAKSGMRGGVAGQTHYEEEIVDRNMKENAEFAVHFFEGHKVRRVLIGGTDDNVAAFRSQLPKSWQSLVVGSFPVSMTASHTDVLEKALQIGQEAESHRENRLVEQLFSGAARGSAEVGLRGALQSVHENRVELLLVMEGFKAPGYRCQTCGLMTALQTQACPACSGEMKYVDDVVTPAIHQAVLNGSNIQVVHVSPSLHKAGDIGAMLRY